MSTPMEVCEKHGSNAYKLVVAKTSLAGGGLTKQRSRRGLAAWMTSAVTPFFVVDDRRVVLVFNQSAERLTGWSAADVIGKTCDFVAESPTGQVENLTNALAPPQSAFQGETQMVSRLLPDPQQGTREYTIHFFPLTAAEEGERQRLLGIIGKSQPKATTSESPHLELTRLLAQLHQKFGLQRFVAVSPEMLRVAARIGIARQSTAAVHLRGEKGVGKEHVARLIHYASDTGEQRFVPVRCNTATHFELQRTLKRLLESADGHPFQGTVYLEYVEELPRDLQQMIVNSFLDDRLRIRWMSSAGDELESLAEEKFSAELRCALTTISIVVPPLRQRLADLNLLALQLLEECNRGQQKQVEGFASQVELEFLAYTWPGNVDELAQIVKTSWLECASGTIQMTDLPTKFRMGRDAQAVAPKLPLRPLEQFLIQAEREHIQAALSAAQGNKSRAAELLDIPRAKLYRRMEALGLEEDSEI